MKTLGRCPDCGQWGTLTEERVEMRPEGYSRYAPGGGEPPVPLPKIVSSSEQRIKTGLTELDRVLGGGVVVGSVVLIGGDPGIGKSTLILQGFHELSKRGKVLYVSGEESLVQIKLRADRLQKSSGDMIVLAETQFEAIIEHAKKIAPIAMVVDSIQTVYTSAMESAPGSIGQVREVAAALVRYAKQSGIAVFIIGHVTKEGAIAGPRVLEHVVDTVLYFEGDKGHSYRLLRAIKNRFGSTNELGVFEMKGSGLVEVADPSGLFLDEQPRGVSGSVVVAALKGTRPILVELQALVSRSYFGSARRTALGVDPNRVSLLLAILEKRAGLHLSDQDVFVNVISGIQIEEPAVDLGILLAIASSFLEKPLNPSSVVFGEVGLGGEVRRVQQAALRVREAARLGFKRCLLPKRDEEGLKEETPQGHTLEKWPEIIALSHVKDALGWLT